MSIGIKIFILSICQLALSQVGPDVSLQTFSGHLNGIQSVFLSGKYIYSGSADGTVKKFNIESGVVEKVFKGHTDSVLSVWVSGNYVITGSADKSIRKWTLAGFMLKKELDAHEGPIVSVTIGPCTSVFEGLCVYSASTDKTIKKWDFNSLNRLLKYPKYPEYSDGHKKTIYSVHTLTQPFDGETNAFVYSSSADGTVKQWDTSFSVAYQTYKGHKGQVLVVLGDPNRDVFYSGSTDNTIMQFSNKLLKGKTSVTPLKVFTGHTGPVWGLSLLGSVLYSASTDGTIKSWNVETGQLIKSFTGDVSEFYSVASSEEYAYGGAISPDVVKVFEGSKI